MTSMRLSPSRFRQEQEARANGNRDRRHLRHRKQQRPCRRSPPRPTPIRPASRTSCDTRIGLSRHRSRQHCSTMYYTATIGTSLGKGCNAARAQLDVVHSIGHMSSRIEAYSMTRRHRTSAGRAIGVAAIAVAAAGTVAGVGMGVGVAHAQPPPVDPVIPQIPGVVTNIVTADGPLPVNPPPPPGAPTVPAIPAGRLQQPGALGSSATSSAIRTTSWRTFSRTPRSPIRRRARCRWGRRLHRILLSLLGPRTCAPRGSPKPPLR